MRFLLNERHGKRGGDESPVFFSLVCASGLCKTPLQNASIHHGGTIDSIHVTYVFTFSSSLFDKSPNREWHETQTCRSPLNRKTPNMQGQLECAPLCTGRRVRGASREKKVERKTNFGIVARRQYVRPQPWNVCISFLGERI